MSTAALEADRGFTTVDIRVNYLRLLTVGKLICHGTGSCLILPRRNA